MIRSILVVALAVCSSGCGTVLNLTGRGIPREIAESNAHSRNPNAARQIYGGIEIDKVYANGFIHHPAYRLIGYSILAFDLPLSAVGDTVTLPVTSYQAVIDYYATSPISRSERDSAGTGRARSEHAGLEE